MKRDCPSEEERPSRTPILLSAVLMPGAGQLAQKRYFAGIFLGGLFLLCFVALATAAVRWIIGYYHGMSRWLTSDGTIPPLPSLAPILWLMGFSIIVYVVNLCDVYLAYLKQCQKWGQKRLEEKLRSMLTVLAFLSAITGSTLAENEQDRLYIAILSNDAATVATMLERGRTDLLTNTFAQGVTPLHLSSALNQPVIVGLCLAAGANIESATPSGFTPLHWAAGRNALDAMRILLAMGANANASSKTGVTPLHWAATKNAVPALKLLISAGASLTNTTTSGLTSLHWAVMGDAEEAQMVLAFHMVSAEDEIVSASTNGFAPIEEPSEFEAEPEEMEEVPPPLETNETTCAEEQDLTPKKRHFARILVVPIGRGQALEFVWLDIARCWFGKYEITNGQFRRFRPSHNSGAREAFSLDGDDQPVVMVSWHDAFAFCKWLSENFSYRLPKGFVFRLPTEIEWVLAAKCGDNRPYPWGHRWPPPYGNFSDLTARQKLSNWRGIRGYDDGFPVSCPVKASGTNEEGIYGLAGNVWEWCDDWFDKKKTYRVRRGGSWDFDDQNSLRIDYRGFDRPETKDDVLGFRIVVGLP